MRPRLALLLLVAVLLVLAVPVSQHVRESMLADRCIDAGGSVDYRTLTCDHGRTHEFVPFSTRHRSLMMGTGVALGLVLVAGAVLVGRRK